MTTITKQVVVERPIAEVLDFARPWSNIPRYLDYIQEVKPLTETEAGVGATYQVNLTFLGRKMTSRWETLAYDENQGWTFKAPLMGVEARKVWRFEPLVESTRVSFALEYDPRPPVIGPLLDAVLLRRRWDRIYERGLRNLKQIVESEAPREKAI